MAEKIYTLPELKKKLTEKERIFCHQYIIDWNGARAARVAGYVTERDRQTAYDKVTKSYIKQYIDFIKNDYEKEAGISKLKNLIELSKIAYSSIADLHDTWITRKEFDNISSEQKSAIESIDTKVIQKNLGTHQDSDVYDIEYVKIKLFSKTTAINMINEMMGYKEAEKIKYSGSIDDVSKIPTKELLERAGAIKTINESKS